MKRTLHEREEINIYTSEAGYICLSQMHYDPEDERESGEKIVAIPPGDVPTIIKWLEEELKKQQTETNTPNN